MKRQTSRWLSALLVLCMALALLTGTVSAEDLPGEPVGAAAETVAAASSASADADLPDSDELFADYVQQLMYGGSDLALFGSLAKSRLTDEKEIALYEFLEEIIKEVAAGNKTNTEKISMDLFAYSWSTYDDLCDSVVTVMSSLSADLPAELYWYDKTGGFNFSCSYDYTEYVLTTFTFTVSADYSPDGAEYGYVYDNRKINTVKAAIDYAKDIVQKYQDAGTSDYDILAAYKDEILALSEYNYDAAENDPPYGDPWQLIWVFDRDPNTTVVCEGYSKAFQYLCDLTEFRNRSIECYSVSGFMDGGAHMWNIVRINGNSYLVDITNTGWDGVPNSLFLKGAVGSVSDGYYCDGVYYSYYSYYYDQTSLWGEDILTLSDSDYSSGSGPDEQSCTITIDSISGENGSVGYTVTSTSAGTKTVYLAAALYENGGKLREIKMVEFELTGGGREGTLKFDTAPDGSDYVKLFLMDQYSAPLCGAQQKTVGPVNYTDFP